MVCCALLDLAFCAIMSGYVNYRSRTVRWGCTRQDHGLDWNRRTHRLDALLATAACLLSRGSYDAAVAPAREILRRDLSGRLAPRAQLLLGSIGLATNDAKGAERALQLVIDRYPGTPSAAKARERLERLGVRQR